MHSSKILVLVLLVACGCVNNANDDTGDTGPSSTSAVATTTTGDSTHGTTAGTTGDSTHGTTAGTTADPMLDPTDCDAIRDASACEAAVGIDFECDWIADAYEVEHDGKSCAVGDAIGWCVATSPGETGCVEDFSYACGDGTDVQGLFVREAPDGTTVLTTTFYEGFNLERYGCFGPELWDVCDGSDPTQSAAACACGCDPGLPSP